MKSEDHKQPKFIKLNLNLRRNLCHLRLVLQLKLWIIRWHRRFLILWAASRTQSCQLSKVWIITKCVPLTLESTTNRPFSTSKRRNNTHCNNNEPLCREILTRQQGRINTWHPKKEVHSYKHTSFQHHLSEESCKYLREMVPGLGIKKTTMTAIVISKENLCLVWTNEVVRAPWKTTAKFWDIPAANTSKNLANLTLESTQFPPSCPTKCTSQNVFKQRTTRCRAVLLTNKVKECREVQFSTKRPLTIPTGKMSKI